MKQSTKEFRYDLVRGIAMLLVILTHFNEVLHSCGIESPLFFTQAGWNMSLGQVGVSLFILMSGTLSVKSLNRCLEAGQGSVGKSIVSYYKKRFLSLMPLFYVAYIFADLFAPVSYAVLYPERVIYSVVGLDGYLLARGVQTNYLVGEWFLGLILICYVLCPLLYLFIKRFPRVTLCLLLVYYVLIVMFFPFSWSEETDVLVRVVDFAVGMYFGLYVKKIPGKAAACCAVITAAICLVKLPVNTIFAVLLQGISCYILLQYLGDRLGQCRGRVAAASKRVISLWAGFCYPVYLVHMITLRDCLEPFAGAYVGPLHYLRILFYCFCVMFLMALIVQGAEKYIMGEITKRLIQFREGKRKKEYPDRDK